ncbi:MAG: thermonuclease family protein [Capnocytophaga sp.]|nr:thermonuclease family protein [Capnocytophaga sp.]
MRCFSFVIALLLSGCGLFSEKPRFDEMLTVTQISDGDSFVALTGDKTEVRLRIHGIDAPEKGQPYSQKSKQQLSDYIFRKQVYIQIEDTDRYGRKVVKVFTPDSTDVGLQMIRSGLAWHYTAYDNSKNYAAAEKEARQKQLGLWNDSNPTPPWKWRAEKRKK